MSENNYKVIRHPTGVPKEVVLEVFNQIIAANAEFESEVINIGDTGLEELKFAFDNGDTGTLAVYIRWYDRSVDIKTLLLQEDVTAVDRTPIKGDNFTLVFDETGGVNGLIMSGSLRMVPALRR